MASWKQFVLKEAAKSEKKNKESRSISLSDNRDKNKTITNVRQKTWNLNTGKKRILMKMKTIILKNFLMK